MKTTKTKQDRGSTDKESKQFEDFRYNCTGTKRLYKGKQFKFAKPNSKKWVRLIKNDYTQNNTNKGEKCRFK